VDEHPDLAVVEVAVLDAAQQAAVSGLLRRAGTAMAHPPLPEPQMRGLAHRDALGAPARIVLARANHVVVGAAFLSPGGDRSTVVHVVVDPAIDEAGDHAELAGALVEGARRAVPKDQTVHLWAMRAGPADDAIAAAHGFESERDVLQMRVPLPLDVAVVEATRPLAVRAFVPGKDEQAWLETNNRAFAGHPEQGAWTIDQLRERMAADWVDLEGFLVADDPDGAGLIGSCWTKIHPDSSPVMGEIYVIAVHPRHHGQGWGRALTVAGLQWITGRAVPVGMLYTDATNEAAVALYRSLGFSIDHTDRSYRRAPG